MTVLAAVSSNLLGFLGLGVVAVAVLVLVISTFHPEARRRPGGYLDGESPQPDEVERDESGRALRD